MEGKGPREEGLIVTACRGGRQGLIKQRKWRSSWARRVPPWLRRTGSPLSHRHGWTPPHQGCRRVGKTQGLFMSAVTEGGGLAASFSEVS